MKAKVIVTFKDIRKKKLRKAGEEFECSEARFEEILKKGKFVERVEPKTANPREKQKKKEDEDL